MNLSFDKYTISPLDTTQAESFFNLINENRNRLIQFFPGTCSRTTTLSETKRYMLVVREQMSMKKYLPYIIYDTSNSNYAGLVDFKNIDWRIPKAEMGYLIDRNYERQGIVTKAAGLAINFVIREYKFRKLLCRISPANPSSIHVTKRLGFQFEGNIRNDFVSLDGEPIDLHYYGRIF